MRVLTINCGSSSLKYDVLELDGGTERRIAQGAVERIGLEPAMPTHAAALRSAFESRSHDATVVVHRVVHGGPRLRDAVLIDDSVLAAIEDATELAPLHNGPALEAIRAARLLFGDAMPMVAVFDTAFYADLPDVAREYALPQELRHRLQIRRYGFHGLAHRYMIERYRALRPNVPEPRLITLQLGNGCSATASRDGRPLDTSMGYTPAEGLIMGTRSGDIDPLLPLLMMERAGMTAEGVEVVLNKEAGLLGLSGISNDMRDLLAAGDARADLAVRAFCYRVTKYIGAYMAVLRGADAVVFGGGIGEHSPEVREAVCEPLAWCGVALDGALNRRQQDDDWFVSSAGSSVEVLVSHVDEASVMARDAVRALEKAG